METEKLPMSSLRDRAHTVSGAAGLRGLSSMAQRRGSGSAVAGVTPESATQSKVISILTTHIAKKFNKKLGYHIEQFLYSFFERRTYSASLSFL